jgi:8-oxo-dGTP pyrophosphatase MutT (NUDIX family)
MERKEKVINCGEAVKFLIVCGRDVLLEKRSIGKHGFPNEIKIPGGRRGKIDGDVRETVLREIGEETGLTEVNPMALGSSFRAITTNSHLYEVQAFIVYVKDKNLVQNLIPEKGKHIWRDINQARDELDWSDDVLILERALKLLTGED